jgi:hypothetical protein
MNTILKERVITIQVENLMKFWMSFNIFYEPFVFVLNVGDFIYNLLNSKLLIYNIIFIHVDLFYFI